MKTSRWVYDVVLTNRSRNELKDAEVEYRIIYDDEVEFLKSSVYPGKGKKQQVGQAVQLPPMTYNGRAEFATPAIDLHTYEYDPQRGVKEYRRDQIVGIWIRVTRNGNIIGEYQSNPAVMHDLAWDGDRDVDIVIRDSFRDQFATERTGE